MVLDTLIEDAQEKVKLEVLSKFKNLLVDKTKLASPSIDLDEKSIDAFSSLTSLLKTGSSDPTGLKSKIQELLSLTGLKFPEVSIETLTSGNVLEQLQASNESLWDFIESVEEALHDA